MNVKEHTYTEVMEKIKSAGLRPTRQRLALASLLFNQSGGHLTAEMLHKKATKARLKTSLATIYNTLNQFRDSGLLKEVVVESGRTYFDTNTSFHHHFYCEDTGQLTDIDGAAIGALDLPKPPTNTEVVEVDIIVRVGIKKTT